MLSFFPSEKITEKFPVEKFLSLGPGEVWQELSAGCCQGESTVRWDSAWAQRGFGSGKVWNK